MGNPEISVIITTFKRDSNILGKAINSVLEQTYTNYELIVVDDNGEDPIYSEMIEDLINSREYKGRIRLIKHIKNMGAQVARNTGIKNAKGKYIAFLDDDDEWLKRKLELQLKKFGDEKNQNLGLVYCGFNVYKQINEKEFIKETRRPSIKLNTLNKELLRKNFIGSTSFPLIRKECIDEVGGFDISLKSKQDYDLWIRISKLYSIDFVAEPLCNYYDHLNERISNNIPKKLEGEKAFLDKHFEDIKRDKTALALKYKLIAKYYLMMNNFIDAKKYLKKSILLVPYSYKNYILYLIALFQFKPKALNRRI